MLFKFLIQPIFVALCHFVLYRERTKRKCPSSSGKEEEEAAARTVWLAGNGRLSASTRKLKESRWEAFCIVVNPELFIPETTGVPDPVKSSESNQIRIHNTGY